MEPSGATGQRGNVTTVLVSTQRTRRPNKVKGLGEHFFRLLLGTINVIFAALGRTASQPSRVMSVTQLPIKESNRMLKRARMETQPVLRFSDKDMVGTIQPHDDALVITLRIEGYDVKRVIVDQGSGVEIMYLDLYKGLNLKLQDLTAYESLLVSFDGKVVIPKGQMRLPV